MTTTSNEAGDLIGSFDLTRFSSLYLVARTLVDGIYQGRHATPDRGGSTEFFDYRMYAAGESLAHVDWKVFGRSDRLYVRRFQHFGNLTLHLIVDGSASMNFAQPDARTGSPTLTKWRYASALAAALAFIAIRQSEQVALGIACDQLVCSIPPSGTWRHLYDVLHTLERFEPDGETGFAASLRQSQQLLPRRRVIVILSDFLGDVNETVEAVRELRFHGNDVSCIQILTPAEIDLTGIDADQFIDIERPAMRAHADPNAIRDEYRQQMRQHIDALRRALTACGVDLTMVTTNEHPVRALRRFTVARRQSRSPGQLTAAAGQAGDSSEDH